MRVVQKTKIGLKKKIVFALLLFLVTFVIIKSILLAVNTMLPKYPPHC